MNTYAISGLINAITVGLLGITVYIKGQKRMSCIKYSLFCFFVFLWCYSYFFWQISNERQTALFYSRGLMMGAIFIPISFLDFTIALLGLQELKKNIVKIGYIVFFIFFLFNFTPLFVKDVSPKLAFTYWPVPGILFGPFLTLWLIYCLYPCYLLFKGYNETRGIKRNQIKYVLTGIAIGYITGSTNYFLWYNIPIPPLGNFIVPLFVTIMAYAIIRYRLMDINIAFRKIISNSLLSAIICFLLISIYILHIAIVSKIITIFIFCIILSTYLPQLKFRIESLTNRILYGTKYDYQETLSEVSDTVPTIIDLNKLLKYITDKVCESMGLDKGAVLLKDDFGNKYSVQYQHGFDGEIASSMKLEAQGPLVSRIKNVEDVLVRHEMIQILNEKDYNDLCTDLDKFEAEVAVPIKKGNSVLGLLTLSDKAGGDTFGQEDFRLLHIIAIQSAVAIENIRLYNKLIHADRQTFLETLASGVSHEMRNRLVAIRTFIDLFPERVQKEHVEPGYFEFRNLAAREMERLTKIIDGLLSYSRAVSKGGEELKVNSLIEESILIIESKLKDKDIKLIKNLGGNVTSIRGDKGRLLQVFINIMQNGIEAMDKNGQLTITSIEKDNEIVVDISDTGKGIDKDHIDAIFEPFFTTKHQGTGLGLSIVQRIVQDHNGQIRVESELGKGTTFFVTFQKGIEYMPEEIKAKEKLGYWEVKKENEKTESSSQ